MQEYLRKYVKARSMARASLAILALVYGMVLFSWVDGWMPWYGVAIITAVFLIIPVTQRWDRTLPPWWAYWGGTIIVLPIDTERKQHMRDWLADSHIPWYHPEDFVYHFQHRRHATLCKLMWGGR
jgi:hypothetical protein